MDKTSAQLELNQNKFLLDTFNAAISIATKDIINELKKVFPKIIEPPKEDICYATTNRQLAVKKIASLCDIIFVIGSNNSSNSQRLVEVAKKCGGQITFLINSGDEKETNDILEKHFGGEISLLNGTKITKLYDEGILSNQMQKFLKVVKQTYSKRS